MQKQCNVEYLKLLKQAIKLFSRSADYWCGNCEGTPCDDCKPKYICKYHRWLKKARSAVKRG